MSRYALRVNSSIMREWFYKIWAKFLTIVGDIKIFRWPFWVIYDPDDFQVRGKQVLEIMELVQPGDIILRGYNRYLDGKFIPNKTGYSSSDSTKNIGKGFSHGALYVGDNKIIHAVAEGVSEIDLIEFTRCDRVAVFRPLKKSIRKSAVKKAKELLRDHTPYDFGFKLGVDAVYCFELCAECYPGLKIPTYTVKKLLGLVKKENVYIAQSFVECEDLELVYCCNPKHSIDFRKKI